MTENKWFIIESGRMEPTLNMGLDEALLNAAVEGMLPGPVFRIYGWTPPAVTMGYGCEAGEDIDFLACINDGVKVVRRITGGGSVLHDREVTYSVIAHSDVVGKNISESFEFVSGALIEGLKELGIVARFAPLNDILVGDKKISGNAQVRRGGFVLQHGTILVGADRERMFRYLKVPEKKLKRKQVAKAADRVTSLELELSRELTYEETAGALVNGFRKWCGNSYEPFEPSDVIMANAITLAEKKYGNEGWMMRRERPQL